MSHVTAQGLESMNAETPRAAGEIADLRPSVVATACLVAIMAQGPRAHVAVEEEIREVLRDAGSDAPVVSSAGALLAALDHLQARRIAIVTPYMKPLTKIVVDYIEESGVEVCDALSLEVSDNLAVGSLDPVHLREHWRRLDVTDADAIVLSACVQMPSLSVLDLVERESGLPTISAATATARALLDALGIEHSVAGAGSILAQDHRTQTST
jgi:maleate isomerase